MGGGCGGVRVSGRVCGFRVGRGIFSGYITVGVVGVFRRWGLLGGLRGYFKRSLFVFFSVLVF